MSERTYRIVFDGIQPNVSAVDAHSRLTALFKASPEQIAALLSSPGHVLKKGVAFTVADRYKNAIESAGGVCRLIPEEPANPNAEVSVPAEPAADHRTATPHGEPSAVPPEAPRSAPSAAVRSPGIPPRAQARKQIFFVFTGQAGEYFRIWIVNLCLSIVTLGIYSAWAKVRRRKYFYGNTLLQDSSFEYLADPKAILMGRVIVFVAFVLYSISKEINWLLGASLLVALLGLLPWLVIRALSFNARYSAHRNVRFGFQAGYGETSRFLTIPVFLISLTLGLIYPYYVYRKKRFVLEHSSYGTTPFAFTATPGAYYQVYMKAGLMFLLFLAGTVVTVGIAALPLYLLFAAYRDGAVARLTWNSTALAGMQFSCSWTTGGLFKLYFLNALGIIFSLGLLAPWAAIRTARYQMERLSLNTPEELDGFAAATQQPISATGDEAGEFLGFDFGL